MLDSAHIKYSGTTHHTAQFGVNTLVKIYISKHISHPNTSNVSIFNMENFQTPHADPSLPEEEVQTFQHSHHHNNSHNNENNNHHHLQIDKTLTKTVLARHSTHIFLDKGVPTSVLEECFQLAQSSPSGTNVQPWRLTVTSGPKLDQLREIMMETVVAGTKSQVPPIPDQFKHYRSDVGHALYGPEGYDISRGDREGTRNAQLRNYLFFDATSSHSHWNSR